MEQRPSSAGRLFVLAGAMSVGVVVAGIARPAALFAGSVGTVVLIAASRRRTVPLLLVAAIALGFALAGLRLASIEGSAVARGGTRNADALLTGQVLTDPEIGPSGARFVLGIRNAVIDGRSFALRERVLMS